jgi:putative cell wall-binding protein
VPPVPVVPVVPVVPPTGYLDVTPLGADPSGVHTTDPAVAGPGTTFYAVSYSPTSGATSVDVTVAGSSATSLYWWDGSAWQKATNVTRDASGDLVVHVTATSGPGLANLNGVVFAAAGLSVDRIAGTDRTGTAIAASQSSYPVAGSAGAVLLARDDVFADALTGGPLAAAKNAPILLTDPAGLLPAVAAELARVLPAGGTVYLLGGLVALHASVADAVTAAGFHVVRVAGLDRFGTAVAIAGALGDPSTVFEATGLNFPDAVSAGPAAIKEHGAILLTDGAAQSPDTAAYLALHKPPATFAIGGAAAAADPNAIGLVGADRYGTAAAVATMFFAGATHIGLATGDDFADPLVAAPALGRAGAPLLLVAATLPQAVAAYLASQAGTIVSATFYGGVDALPAAVLTQVQLDAP